MTSFSERHGYKPDRSRAYQFEKMDERLKNAVWNFLWARHFDNQNNNYSESFLGNVWTDVVGGRYDNLFYMGNFNSVTAKKKIREWYFNASWYEVYDVLEYVLSKSPYAHEKDDANAILRREGAAYTFIDGVIAPITNDEELAEVEDALQHTGQFDAASQHIKQAVEHLGDRGNPDPRNVIKESISAVESAIKVASGNPNADIEKGLKKLGLHSQLEQAWKNMYNWTSDEGGVRHGKEEISQVGLAEARYMVVASSAFVNYLISKSSETGSI